MLDGTWGYDVKGSTIPKRLRNKRESFTEALSIRLQDVQIENTDALRIIRSRDYEKAFHYCDPPYFNSDCGHYDGYSREDFEALLKVLENCEGKFLLSSYPSDILKYYTEKNDWYTRSIEQSVSVASGTGGGSKWKIEVLTANYDLSNPNNTPTLFG